MNIFVDLHHKLFPNILLALMFMFSASDLSAQSDSTAASEIHEERFFSFLVGFNGGANTYGEIGIARNRINIVGHHAAGSTVFFSTEVGFGALSGVVGPKIGIWAGGGVAPIAMGMNLICYTDFSRATIRIRPEIGLGLDRFKLVYGYNIGFTHKIYPGVNTNNLSIVVLLQLKKLE